VTNGSVARRYAKALLELGIESNSFDSMGRELERTAELFAGSAELHKTLTNPVFSLEKRRAVLEEIARRTGLGRIVRNFLLLLLEKGRIAALPDIAREHRALVDAQAGRLRATVTTAKALDPMQEQRLRTALEKQTGKVVVLTKREDPALLGGVVAQVGDVVFDGSVRAQLARLREELL
jgi:F-type H+-transporting ATPase subunit delta